MVDPNETPETVRKRELFQCYRRGWKHGSANGAQDKRFVDHTRTDVRDAYQRGWNDGRDAWIVESIRECERLQYDPRCSILREQPPANPPGPASPT
jgi:hypothetical protein